MKLIQVSYFPKNKNNIPKLFLFNLYYCSTKIRVCNGVSGLLNVIKTINTNVKENKNETFQTMYPDEKNIP